MSETERKSKPGGKNSVPAGKMPCDFCDSHAPCLIPINDGIWAICRDCYDHVYGGEEE